MVASRPSTKFGPLVAGAEVNGVAVMVGMVRFTSRSSVSVELLLGLVLLLLAEIGLVPMVALALIGVDATPAPRGAGVTMKVNGTDPADTSRLPMLQVMAVPGPPACVPPPAQPAVGPTKVTPALTLMVNTVLVASDGPLFKTVRS